MMVIVLMKNFTIFVFASKRKRIDRKGCLQVCGWCAY